MLSPISHGNSRGKMREYELSVSQRVSVARVWEWGRQKVVEGAVEFHMNTDSGRDRQWLIKRVCHELSMTLPSPPLHT